jgi:hypothetical protein
MKYSINYAKSFPVIHPDFFADPAPPSGIPAVE